jgi:hypothetical protein
VDGLTRSRSPALANGVSPRGPGPSLRHRGGPEA